MVAWERWFVFGLAMFWGIQLFWFCEALRSAVAFCDIRTPKSLLAGLMWLGVKDNRYSLRHTCEEGDKLSRYAWVRHDGATYGRQVLFATLSLPPLQVFLKQKQKKSITCDMSLLQNAEVLFLLIEFTSAGNS